jgi:hypothetical protein
MSIFWGLGGVPSKCTTPLMDAAVAGSICAAAAGVFAVV